MPMDQPVTSIALPDASLPDASLPDTSLPASPADSAQTPGRTRAKPRLKHPKAASAAACEALEQLPNIGPSLAADLRLIGIVHPKQLQGQDPLRLYDMLCTATGKRHDPCVLDTFMAATDFMQGAAPTPWWHYTELRKARYSAVLSSAAGTRSGAQTRDPTRDPTATPARPSVRPNDR